MMALFTGVRSMLELVLVSYVVLAWAGLSRLVERARARRGALRLPPSDPFMGNAPGVAAPGSPAESRR